MSAVDRLRKIILRLKILGRDPTELKKPRVGVYIAHLLFDKKIPNRQSDYFREIDEMVIKFAPDEKCLKEIEYLGNTHHVVNEGGLLYRV